MNLCMSHGTAPFQFQARDPEKRHSSWRAPTPTNIIGSGSNYPLPPESSWNELNPTHRLSMHLCMHDWGFHQYKLSARTCTSAKLIKLSVCETLATTSSKTFSWFSMATLLSNTDIEHCPTGQVLIQPCSFLFPNQGGLERMGGINEAPSVS